MRSFSVIKTGSKEKRLRYTLSSIGALIFAVSFLVVFCAFSKNPVYREPSQLVIIALTLILVVAGFVIVHQIFFKIPAVASRIKKDAAGEEYLIDVQKKTAELDEVKDAFAMLMDSLEKTSAELKQKTLELFAIKELTEITGKRSDSDCLLDALLEKAMTVTGARIGSVYMVQAKDRRFRIVASRGLESAPESNSYIAFDDSLARLVVTEGKPLLLHDNATGAGMKTLRNPPSGTPSFLSMPIYAGGNLIATLNLAHVDAKDEQILSIMINEVGFALENVMHLSEIEGHLKNFHDGRGVELTTKIDQRDQEIVT
jgi:two-component system cell cycle sensor histidine kinase/response regulator CckA